MRALVFAGLDGMTSMTGSATWHVRGLIETVERKAACAMPPQVMQAVNYLGLLPRRDIPNVTLELGPDDAATPRIAQENNQPVLLDHYPYKIQAESLRDHFKKLDSPGLRPGESHGHRRSILSATPPMLAAS